MRASLECKTFSYYAFHPKSKMLSERDQKIALTATILMGITLLGVGHLICGIIQGIQSCQLVHYIINEIAHDRLNFEVADGKLTLIENRPKETIKEKDLPRAHPVDVPKKVEVAIDGALASFKRRIDSCFDIFERDIKFERFQGISIMIAFGDESRHFVQFPKRDTMTKRALQQKVNAFLKEIAEQLKDQPGDDYELEIKMFGRRDWGNVPTLKTSMVMKKGKLINTDIDGSTYQISQEKDIDFKSSGS